jgi:REP element-mobilizing transposase RayT
MPTPSKCWWHNILSTHGSWLPGNPRGFRSREHRIHSSGDYKNPPPPGEHAGLHRYHSKRTKKTVLLAADREVVGRSLWQRAEELGHRMRTIAVSFTHAHMLVEMPDDKKKMKTAMGECKRTASFNVSENYESTLWAKLGDFNRVETQDYWENCHHYILGQEQSWIMWIEKGEIRIKVT